MRMTATREPTTAQNQMPSHRDTKGTNQHSPTFSSVTRWIISGKKSVRVQEDRSHGRQYGLPVGSGEAAGRALPRCGRSPQIRTAARSADLPAVPSGLRRCVGTGRIRQFKTSWLILRVRPEIASSVTARSVVGRHCRQGRQSSGDQEKSGPQVPCTRLPSLWVSVRVDASRNRW